MKISVPFLRTPYNYDTMEASNASALECLDLSLAQQHARDETDINTIVKRFGLTGELPNGVSMPRYGDFTAVSTYHEAMNVVLAADAAFMRLPADVRTRFNNDPGQFVDFVSDDNNRAEAEKLGIVPAAVAASNPGIVPAAVAASNPAPEGGGVAQSST